MSLFFFFNDTATTEIYTLSLHDALPICRSPPPPSHPTPAARGRRMLRPPDTICRSLADRKSTRLNSSHVRISYAVFCLKKKKKALAHLTQHTQRPKSTCALLTSTYACHS